MVRKPVFKLIANGKDISAKIARNLIELSFLDNIGFESDEIEFSIFGIYEKPMFGDSLELWLGYENDLWKCGQFSVATCKSDYLANVTQIRATAVNFSAPLKQKNTKTWQNTSVFKIAKQIASQNSLALKTNGNDLAINSLLQDNISDVEFIYNVAFKFGYLGCIKNGTLIITNQQEQFKNSSNLASNLDTNLPKFKLNLSELSALEIIDTSRNSYSCVILQWQDIKEAKLRSLKIGSGVNAYKMRIAQPKSETEALMLGKAKLKHLQSGGKNGRLTMIGRNIIAGARLQFNGIAGLKNDEFNIKSVRHNLNTSSYVIDVEFEG